MSDCDREFLSAAHPGRRDCDRCRPDEGHNVFAASLRQRIAAEIAVHADDDSDVSDAYRHAALIASGGQRK